MASLSLSNSAKSCLGLGDVFSIAAKLTRLTWSSVRARSTCLQDAAFPGGRKRNHLVENEDCL